MHFFADYGSPLSYVHICRYQSFLIGINRESLGGEKKSSTRIRSIEKKKKPRARRAQSRTSSVCKHVLGSSFFCEILPPSLRLLLTCTQSEEDLGKGEKCTRNCNLLPLSYAPPPSALPPQPPTMYVQEGGGKTRDLKFRVTSCKLWQATSDLHRRLFFNMGMRGVIWRPDNYSAGAAVTAVG